MPRCGRAGLRCAVCSGAWSGVRPLSVLMIPFAALVLLAALGMLVLVIRTGDSGARAVWG